MLQMHSFRPSTDSIYEPAQTEIGSVQRGVTLSPTNYCLVLIACSSMCSEQTYQQKCGGWGGGGTKLKSWEALLRGLKTRTFSLFSTGMKCIFYLFRTSSQTEISLPFIYFDYWNPYSFIYLKLEEGTSFWTWRSFLYIATAPLR